MIWELRRIVRRLVDGMVLLGRWRTEMRESVWRVLLCLRDMHMLVGWGRYRFAVAEAGTWVFGMAML